MTMLRQDRAAAPEDALEACSRPRLVIGVIGGIGLSVAGAPLPLASRKARALLAYLALEARPAVSRERLAGLLWGDAGERQARNSLRGTLFELREALEGRGCAALRADRDAVALLPGAVDCDLDGLLAALGAGLLPDRGLADYARAEALLAGYDDLSPIFDEWLAATRQAVRQRVLRALERGYADAALPRRDRLRLAEAVLRLEPLHEAACRCVMRIAAEDGETGLALRCYAALYEQLGVELDMEPSAPTQALVAEIKRGRLDPPPVPPPPVAPPGAAAQPALQGGVPVLAVLPFRPIGDVAPPAFLAEGIVEDIVAMLAARHEPVVISANSTRGLDDRNLDLARLGERLGAQYLVTGTVRAAAGQTRIAVELVEAASGAVIWSNVYDASGDAVFAAQARIAATLANVLAPRVNEAELRRTRRRPPDDLGAYHLLLQARELIFRLEREAFEQAGAMLRRAAVLDPDFAAIPATLADWHSLRVFQGWSPDPAADLVALEEATRAALRIDPRHARALALLGHNRTIAERRYEEALALFERALAAAPNDAETWMWTVPTFAYAGQPAEAIRRAERAIALSPNDPLLFRHEHFLGIAHYAAGDFAAALHWGRRSDSGNPNYTSNLRFTAAALVALGRAAEAAPLARRAMALEPRFTVGAVVRRLAFRAEAERSRYGQRLIEAGFPA